MKTIFNAAFFNLPHETFSFINVPMLSSLMEFVRFKIKLVIQIFLTPADAALEGALAIVGQVEIPMDSV